MTKLIRINGFEFPVTVSEDNAWETMELLLTKFSKETGCEHAVLLCFFSSESETETEEKFVEFFKGKLPKYWKNELYGTVLPMFKVWLSQFKGQPITLDTRIW